MSADAQPQSGNGRAYLVLAVAALCWAANAVFGRLAVGEISPMLLVSLRWLGVFLLLCIFARRHVKRDWPVLRTRLVFIGAMGALGFAIFNALFYVAAHSTTAVNLGILQGSVPVFVILGMYLAHRVQVTKIQIAGVIVTLIGVAIVATGGSIERLTTLAFNIGDLLMLAACALYSGYTIGLRQRPDASALGLFTLLVAAAFVTTIPLVGAEAWLGQLQWPSPKGWVIVSLVTLFPSFLAQICFMQGVSLIGPNRAGVFVNLVPVFASILAVSFLREPFEYFHAAALLLVLSGIWLSERGKTDAR